MDSLGSTTIEFALIMLVGILAFGVLAFRLMRMRRYATHGFGGGAAIASPQFREHADSGQGKQRNRPATPKSSLQGGHTLSSDASTADITAQIHILASVQTLDARRQGIELRTADKTLKTLAAAYLYGASFALTFCSALTHDEAFALAVKAISHNLDLGEVSVNQMLATLTRSSSSLECYRNGLEGAEFWTVHRYVPKHQSLYTSLTENALI